MKAYWTLLPVPDSTSSDAKFSGSDDATAYACQHLGETTINILPYMHAMLAYLFGLAFVPNALIYVERFIPWENITIFLGSSTSSSRNGRGTYSQP
jgi:hypothetical protein